MQDKPGVMIYFDIQETVGRLSDKNAGVLFRAILEYSFTGCEPELPNSLRLLWPMIRMRLDTDDQRYRQVTQKRKYAIYVRWTKVHGQEPLSYEDWVLTLDSSPKSSTLPLS